MSTDNEATSDCLNFEGINFAAAAAVVAHGKSTSTDTLGPETTTESSTPGPIHASSRGMDTPVGMRFGFLELGVWPDHDSDNSRTVLLDVATSGHGDLASEDHDVLGEVRNSVVASTGPERRGWPPRVWPLWPQAQTPRTTGVALEAGRRQVGNDKTLEVLLVVFVDHLGGYLSGLYCPNLNADNLAGGSNGE